VTVITDRKQGSIYNGPLVKTTIGKNIVNQYMPNNTTPSLFDREKVGEGDGGLGEEGEVTFSLAL